MILRRAHDSSPLLWTVVVIAASARYPWTALRGEVGSRCPTVTVELS